MKSTPKNIDILTRGSKQYAKIKQRKDNFHLLETKEEEKKQNKKTKLQKKTKNSKRPPSLPISAAAVVVVGRVHQPAAQQLVLFPVQSRDRVAVAIERPP